MYKENTVIMKLFYVFAAMGIAGIIAYNTFDPFDSDTILLFLVGLFFQYVGIIGAIVVGVIGLVKLPNKRRSIAVTALAVYMLSLLINFISQNVL